ncbi:MULTISPECIES: helix-turn-helix domain-containing protein [Nostoc]|uniref:helix-turn-helix domain-containing protein n=1 Tax=Nostoc TaxID=1177 RepID=UPI0028C40491|nr:MULTISPECIES: helix-turn-helix domain-containing protein [Nostoc]
MAKQSKISKLVRDLRQELNLSQSRFAAELNVAFTTIKRWQNRRAAPSSLAMERISILLNELGDRGKILETTYFGEEE